MKIPTDGQPGIFTTLDAGAPKTLGLYFMYDVKLVDPSEWSSLPWDAKLVEKSGLGTVLVGRGAVNQKGPEASLIAALHAIRAAGRKPPVNLVLVAEGEEEIGTPHFPQIVRRPQVIAALRPCVGIFMPSAEQDLDGMVTMTLAPREWSNSNWCRAESAGGADRDMTFTPATRRVSIVRRGIRWLPRMRLSFARRSRCASKRGHRSYCAATGLAQGKQTHACAARRQGIRIKLAMK